ncbi:MAG TPA: cytochrome b/b6 domain-containing protein [Alphaproteobacteria bacterium]
MLGLKNRVAGLNYNRPKTIQWLNSLEQYGLRAQLLHAVIGAAVILMLALGLSFSFLPASIKGPAVMLHKGLGIWILFASLLWFLSWLQQPTPAALSTQKRPQYRLAKLVHRIMLGLCILMPLSGWVMVSAFSGNDIAIAPNLAVPALVSKDMAFGQAMLGLHILLAWILLGLLALHVSAALYHHIYRRDPILKRMIPRFRPPEGYYRRNFERGIDIARKQR